MNWIREHKFESHLASFLLMVVPAALLYFTTQGEAAGPIWVLVGIFIAGNLLAMITK